MAAEDDKGLSSTGEGSGGAGSRLMKADGGKSISTELSGALTAQLADRDGSGGKSRGGEAGAGGESRVGRGMNMELSSSGDGALAT